MTRIYYSIYGPFITKFIALKNSLGYQYKDAGNALSLLDRLAQRNAITRTGITKELADEYSLKRPNESEKTRYNRIQIFCQFVQFLCDLGIRSYKPRLPKYNSSFVPHIFSTEEMSTIFSACDSLSPPLRSRNTATFAIPFLIRLLYATGIRINEALHLTRGDINIEENFLILRKTKSGKDRMIPMTSSLVEVCRGYLTYRALLPGGKKTNKIFILPDGTSLSSYTAYKWFRRIIWSAKISHGGRGKGPRLHDIRHTFSVHSLALMARQGLDLYHSLPILSTYLGHQSLDATDGYVRLTTEMYPDLIKRMVSVSASAFPMIDLNLEDDDAN
jgi:integrase/recombinase XerD